MRKIFLAFALILGEAIFTEALAEQQIPMQIIKDHPASNSGTFAPPRPWYITENNNVLTMPTFENDYTLELRDEDDNVVYTTYLLAGTTMVILPSTLSGDFELRLVGDSYYYRGYLSL